MEPVTITAAATAITTIIGTKALEKTGEKLGETLLEQCRKLIEQIQHKLPKVANAIQATEQQKPLDYAEAVPELKAAADKDPELAQAVQDVEAAAKAEPNPKITQTVQEVENTLKFQQPNIQNLAKSAEKIGVVNQGAINNQTNNLNI